eukprot:642143-Pleurochrysis_carterae.AAC.1
MPKRGADANEIAPWGVRPPHSEHQTRAEIFEAFPSPQPPPPARPPLDTPPSFKLPPAPAFCLQLPSLPFRPILQA